MTRKYPIDSVWFSQMIEAQDKSVRGLARFMNLDPASVSRMLNGKRKMSAVEQDKVAQFFGIGLEEIAAHRNTLETGFAETSQETYLAPGEPILPESDREMFTEADIIYKDGKRWFEGLNGELIALHPAYGCMKGTMIIPDDLDLTAPMDIEWSDKLYNE